MSTQVSLKDFENIYNLTYHPVLKYIMCKCSNICDVNDLIQDTYVELYHILKRKDYLVIDNIINYVIGIAKKKIQRYYGIFYKVKMFSFWNSKDEMEIDIPADFDLEDTILTKLSAESVLSYIKKKDSRVIKIFYLYYYLDLKISEIAVELNISESNVKNLLYRTLKEMKENTKIEGDENVQ